MVELKFGTRFGTRCVPEVLQIRLFAPCKSLKRCELQVLSSGCLPEGCRFESYLRSQFFLDFERISEERGCGAGGLHLPNAVHGSIFSHTLHRGKLGLSADRE